MVRVRATRPGIPVKEGGLSQRRLGGGEELGTGPVKREGLG